MDEGEMPSNLLKTLEEDEAEDAADDEPELLKGAPASTSRHRPSLGEGDSSSDDSSDWCLIK